MKERKVLLQGKSHGREKDSFKRSKITVERNGSPFAFRWKWSISKFFFFFHKSKAFGKISYMNNN
jgi:hypothetical protein